MWRLLKADLQNRLGLMLAAFGLVLGCGLGLSLIASSTEPILGWVVSASIVVPTLINIVGGSTDAREHRLQLHRVLPVATVEIAAARFTAPVIVQLSGSLIGTGLVIVGMLIREQRVVGLGRVIVLSGVLLILGQWILLQGELRSRARGATWRALGYGGASIASALLAATLFFAVFVGVEHLLPASGPTAAVAVAATSTTAALIGTNLFLFIRRDATGG
jgi:hypothetical protein